MSRTVIPIACRKNVWACFWLGSGSFLSRCILEHWYSVRRPVKPDDHADLGDPRRVAVADRLSKLLSDLVGNQDRVLEVCVPLIEQQREHPVMPTALPAFLTLVDDEQPGPREVLDHFELGHVRLLLEGRTKLQVELHRGCVPDRGALPGGVMQEVRCHLRLAGAPPTAEGNHHSFS